MGMLMGFCQPIPVRVDRQVQTTATLPPAVAMQLLQDCLVKLAPSLPDRSLANSSRLMGGVVAANPNLLQPSHTF